MSAATVKSSEKFQRLAAEWRDEIAHLPSITKIVMHPKYQNIIGLGPDVLHIYPFLRK